MFQIIQNAWANLNGYGISLFILAVGLVELSLGLYDHK